MTRERQPQTKEMTRAELFALLERQCNCMDMLTADRDRTNVELKRIDVAARKLEDLTKAWKARAEKAEGLLSATRRCGSCDFWRDADNAYGDAVGMVCHHRWGDEACQGDDEDPFTNWEQRGSGALAKQEAG